MIPNQRTATTALTPEAIVSSHTKAPAPVADYALGLGDDALILAQRLGEWIANAPELEEDVALGNIGLDLLGHARSLLSYAGSAWDKSEDDLAYFRREPEFRCRQLFEQPNGDFAQTIARQLIASVYFGELYRVLQSSDDAILAAIAAKAAKELAYHLDHSVQWLLRLGLGTEVSHERMQRGIDTMWPLVGELFSPDRYADAVSGISVDPASLRDGFDALVPGLIADAGLEVPQVPFARGGGRDGIHSESLGPLLAEMQVLAREHPEASW